MTNPTEKKCCEKCIITYPVAEVYKADSTKGWYCTNTDCSCHTKTSADTTESGWEERFLKQFEYPYVQRDGTTTYPLKAKARIEFIRETIAQEKEKSLKEGMERASDFMFEALTKDLRKYQVNYVITNEMIRDGIESLERVDERCMQDSFNRIGELIRSEKMYSVGHPKTDVGIIREIKVFVASPKIWKILQEARNLPLNQKDV